MGKKDYKIKKGINIAINFLLFAILYFSVSFNKEFIRPIYGDTPIIGILTGSFSNFMAAYIISLFPFSPVLANKLDIKKSRLIVYSVAVVIFILLTIEEIKPYTDASKVYDMYDIIASGLGSLSAILTFEIFFIRIVNKSNMENGDNELN